MLSIVLNGEKMKVKDLLLKDPYTQKTYTINSYGVIAFGHKTGKIFKKVREVTVFTIFEKEEITKTIMTITTFKDMIKNKKIRWTII